MATTTRTPQPFTSPGKVDDGRYETSVVGDATGAAVSVWRSGDTISIYWTHPEALMYTMRYRKKSSTAWTWRKQTASTFDIIDGIDPGISYVIEVVAHIGGIWRNWNSVEVPAAVAV